MDGTLTILRLGTLVAQGQLAAVGPICPGDAKQAADSAAAVTCLVASTDGLADASQAHISHRLICFGFKDHSNQIKSVQFIFIFILFSRLASKER